jgi:hypothetical protein
MSQVRAVLRRAAVRVAGPAVAVGLLVVAGGAPAHASTASQVPVDGTGFFGGLNDVTAVSASDGWAVGGDTNGVVQRFNGTRWSLVPSPDLLTNGNTWATLTGVDATSATSAFAVGRATGANNTGVALRWNGSTWSRLAVPATGSPTAFAAVKAFSGTDVWAVGGDGSTTQSHTNVAMHFNGGTWSPVPIPSPGTQDNVLRSVDGSGPGDVWAVGFLRDQPYGNRIRVPMILHWNGTAWSSVPSLGGGAGFSTYLYDVAAVSATDAWAVGETPGVGAFVERWNGTAWSAAPAPMLSSAVSVVARSANDVWLAGFDPSGAPAVAHWTGSGWSVTPVSVTGGVGSPALTSITAADATSEWAVGYQWDGTTGQSSSIAFRVTG